MHRPCSPTNPQHGDLLCLSCSSGYPTSPRSGTFWEGVSKVISPLSWAAFDQRVCLFTRKEECDYSSNVEDCWPSLTTIPHPPEPLHETAVRKLCCHLSRIFCSGLEGGRGPLELYLRVRPGHERPEQGEVGRVASWCQGSEIWQFVALNAGWRSGAFP